MECRTTPAPTATGRSAHRTRPAALAAPLVALASAAALALTGAGGAAAATTADPALVAHPVEYVDTLAGTGSGGDVVGSINNFPGPAAPYGMVQFSPDTGDSYAGYYYDNTDLKGFSLTHASVGCTAFGDIPVLPTTGEVGDRPWEKHATIDKSHETGTPGYYGVRLSDTGVRAELTAGTRVGVAAFTFPDGAPAQVLVRPGSSKSSDSAASLHVADDGTVTGSTTTGGFCGKNNTYTVHFAMRFDRQPTAHGTWDERSTSPGSDDVDSPRAGGWFSFPAGSTVHAEVALSYTSTDAALANLTAELPGPFDAAHGGTVFDDTRASTSARWDDLLGKVRVAASTPEDELRTFYHSLYRSFLHPNTYSDADGHYLGYDGKDHALPAGHVQYERYSDWDTYRTLAPLQAMLTPDVADDLAQSLVNAAQQMGSYPRWSIANAASGQMSGDSPTALVASLHAFGATGFDTATALRYMRRGASDAGGEHTGGTNPTYVERPGAATYNALGYAPQTSEYRADHRIAGASITQEWSVDDFAIGRFAAALGDTAVADEFAERGQRWQNLFDPASRCISPRDAFGAFADAPCGRSVTSGFGQDGYDEGTAEQYLWMVPQDTADLVEGLGGRRAALERLDRFMTHGLNVGANEPYMWAGNEPNFGTPWVYNHLGAPWRTSEVVDEIRTTLFGHAPHGAEPGNDDLGAQSSWYVWAALGIYPATPGTDVLTVNTPAFDRAVVSLGDGRTLTLDAPGATSGDRYIGDLAMDGKRTRSTALPKSVVDGRDHTVTYTLAPHRTDWATSTKAAPPSWGAGSRPLVASVTPGTVSAAPGDDVDLGVTAQLFAAKGPSVTATVGDLPAGVSARLASHGTVMVDDHGRAAVPLHLAVDDGVEEGWYTVDVTVATGHGSKRATTTAPLSLHVTTPGSLESARTVVGTAPEDAPAADLDGAGNSISRDRLADEAGITPGSRQPFGTDGLSYTWPSSPVGRPDTVVASGQTITLDAPARELAFVGTGVNSGGQAGATVTLDDGTTARADFSFGDWVLPSGTAATGQAWPYEPRYGNSVVAWVSYRNGRNDPPGAYVFGTTPYTAPAGRTVVSVTLPSNNTARLFAIATS